LSLFSPEIARHCVRGTDESALADAALLRSAASAGATASGGR